MQRQWAIAADAQRDHEEGYVVGALASPVKGEKSKVDKDHKLSTVDNKYAMTTAQQVAGGRCRSGAGIPPKRDASLDDDGRQRLPF